jgi:hypothetical protein
MTVDERLDALRALIQHDVGNRGLARDPADNLLTHTAGDFAAACHSIAETPNAGLAVVTGFYIPTADPPAGETDGPLGAVFLARALVPAGVRVAIVTDGFCERAVAVGLEAAGLRQTVPMLTLPPAVMAWDAYLDRDWRRGFQGHFPLTHLIALERVGPSHTPESIRGQPGADAFLREVPPERHDRCHTMRGRDITAQMAPAHRLIEHGARQEPRLTTIGIGDGGNEIGMGKVPWDTIRRNVPDGGLTACRVPTDHLIVAGVSNWGAYALAAGVLLLRGEKEDAALFDTDRERRLLQTMVEQGPLVDGMTTRRTATVDGLTWEQYAAPLAKMGQVLR